MLLKLLIFTFSLFIAEYLFIKRSNKCHIYDSPNKSSYHIKRLSVVEGF